MIQVGGRNVLVNSLPGAHRRKRSGSSNRVRPVVPFRPLHPLLVTVAVEGRLPVGAQSILMHTARGAVGDYVVGSRSNDRSSV